MARGPVSGTNQARAWLRQYGRVSERALAETFAREFDSRWRYNEDEGYWLQWTGSHWAKRQTLQFMEALGFYAAAFADTFRRLDQITHTEATKLQSQRTVSALERMCRSLPSFLANNALFDADPFALGTPGGTVDLRTGVMRPANPNDYITIITPIAPAAAGTPAPRWQGFLDAITGGDRDFQKTLQQFAGIGAQGTSRDQRILFLYGSGGNGKGVYLRTLAWLLGAHAVNAPRDLLMLEKYSGHTTHLIDVLKARMALATEVDDDMTWDVGLVKNLTGGDAISVNRMRQDPFTITACCTLTISGNRKPALKGVDEAVRRRFLVATFKLQLTPDQVIVDLEKEFIKAEGAAILRWVIDGSVSREVDTRLHVAKVIHDDTEDYFQEENVMQDFINTNLIPAPHDADPVWRVKTSEVYDSWRAFCSRSGRPCGARNSFTTAMQAAGVKYQRTMDGRYFLNVHLRLGFE